MCLKSEQIWCLLPNQYIYSYVFIPWFTAFADWLSPLSSSQPNNIHSNSLQGPDANQSGQFNARLDLPKPTVKSNWGGKAICVVTVARPVLGGRLLTHLSSIGRVTLLPIDWVTDAFIATNMPAKAGNCLLSFALLCAYSSCWCLAGIDASSAVLQHMSRNYNLLTFSNVGVSGLLWKVDKWPILSSPWNSNSYIRPPILVDVSCHAISLLCIAALVDPRNRTN